jgi:hypothetical protein
MVSTFPFCEYPIKGGFDVAIAIFESAQIKTQPLQGHVKLDTSSFSSVANGVNDVIPRIESQRTLQVHAGMADNGC